MKKREKKATNYGEITKKIQKTFRTVLGILAAFVVILALFLYFNYDYLAFKYFLTSSYIYTETLDEIYKTYLDTDTNGRYLNDFDNMVIAVTTERIRAQKGDRYTYLYTPKKLQDSLKYDKDEAALSEVNILNDSTIYLKLTNFTKHTEKFMEENIEKLGNRPNIIIDLRENRGGDISVMVNISSMFLPKKSVVATDRYRWMEQVFRSNRDQPLKYDKIIILQNNNTASASENMIAALNDNLDNVELIGSETFGKGIGQFTMPLRRGYAVKATILEWMTPSGINIQGDGIDRILNIRAMHIQFALDALDNSVGTVLTFLLWGHFSLFVRGTLLTFLL
jgi:C-terminal peptidase prc